LLGVADSFVTGMKRRAPSLILAGAAGLFAMSVAAAQKPATPSPPPFAAPPFKNLKIFAQDTSRADLLANMRFLSQSLGVRCTYCHVGEEGKPLSTFDFASDAKPNKAIARDMLRMADRLNSKDLPAIGGLIDPQITCYTCHRGATKPATKLPEVPAAAPAAPPTPPKIERG
jgi:hypothetical protein